MDVCPPQSNLTTTGYSRVELRKAFAFFGWSVMCAAIGFTVAGEQWVNGVDAILNPSGLVSGISAQNLSHLEISFAGMLVSGMIGIAFFVHGCFLFASEKRIEAVKKPTIVC